jgi:hypothetical protein
MSTLIRVGKLVMTPEQFQRALDEDMTVSQALKMIAEDKQREFKKVSASPSMSDVENEPAVPTGD